jgi:N-acetylmuramoyl-L-alanine amidase
LKLAVLACLIGIDVGHDAIDFGTLTASGGHEWHYNLATATTIHDALGKAGIKSVLLNADGRPIPLADRPRLAAEQGVTLFVAVHHDSAQEQYLPYPDLFSGYGLFTSIKNPGFAQSVEVAKAMGDSLLASGMHPSLHHAEAIKGENRPLIDPKRGIYRFDDLVVLRTAIMPALLVEAGVVINPEEEKAAASQAYRDKIAAAVLAGARKHCTMISPAPR